MRPATGWSLGGLDAQRPITEALPCHDRVALAFPSREGLWWRDAMDGSLTKGWEDELERWLEPFLQRLRRKAQRRWAPFYLKGLILAFAFLQHLRLRLGGKKR